MNSKQKILALTAMAMCFDSMHKYDESQIDHDKTNRLRERLAKKPTIPKGCKLYLFDTDGTYTFNREPNKCYIEIVAINEKSAIKKFNKQTAHENNS